MPGKLLTIGSVAFDDIETPFGKIQKTLGGSATYISLAASYFCKPSLIAVVGADFKKEHFNVFKKRGVNLSGLEIKKGKTFSWGGIYHFDLNTRDTIFTHLNVFEKFSPALTDQQKTLEYILLGNIDPKLQIDIINQLKSPKFIGLDTMNLWIEKKSNELTQALKMVDALIINDSESRELSKEHNILKAAKKILAMMRYPRSPRRRSSGTFPEDRLLGPVLIIKQGEHGLLMFTASHSFPNLPAGKAGRGSGGVKIFHLPGYPLEDVLDPTGAGDSFAGGFMGFIASKQNLNWENLKKAAAYGSVMASFAVEKFGTLALQNLRPLDIRGRYKNFKNLTHFEI